MTKPVKMSLGLVGAFLLVVVGLLSVAAVRDDSAPPPVAVGESRLVRADSHVLGAEGSSDVTFVEFLDFECEGCLAAYPVVEQLREAYAGRVTFVARYFPMPGHFNAERAARAVEAAAQQGQFEAMYQRMYDTQEEWAHQQVPLDDLYRTYADDLGLDMDQYDADYNDPATVERIKADQADGVALGVEGTPTFFINGEPIQPKSVTDLTEALDAALDD